ncbi:DUF2730 family protein [Methylorubrum zatmanii]
MISASVPDPWLAAAVGAFVLSVLAIALFAVRERRAAPSTDAKLDALAQRMDVNEAKLKETDHDVRSIKMVVQNLPTKDSINAIAVDIAKTQGKMETVQASLVVISKQYDRIEDYLMKTSAETIASVKAAATKINGE